jgi:hypothetical protein
MATRQIVSSSRCSIASGPVRPEEGQHGHVRARHHGAHGGHAGAGEAAPGFGDQRRSDAVMRQVGVHAHGEDPPARRRAELEGADLAEQVATQPIPAARGEADPRRRTAGCHEVAEHRLPVRGLPPPREPGVEADDRREIGLAESTDGGLDGPGARGCGGSRLRGPVAGHLRSPARWALIPVRVRAPESPRRAAPTKWPPPPTAAAAAACRPRGRLCCPR